MLNVPNILTIFRLIAAPMVVLIFLILPRPYADWIALVLFVGASLTDFLDGYLARLWKQTSKLGAMLDPIADKAMVILALIAVVSIYGAQVHVIVPAALIAFREVFVSGLREYLGDTAGTLKVTKLAKWKTAVQMVAIGVLLGKGIIEHGLYERIVGMDPALVDAILSGAEEDLFGLRWREAATNVARTGGFILMWAAAILTLITGWDYFRKALPHLRDT
ncbi:CDP-diacylglycerol--glycerol-3-phosphate 3-phosphatidyltransferase [Shimia ponticola]|uniref:CDP-diacylglycerol--glycerol-3-phosphate 3-phosphatidyltransferase n=1 Tax=Shimia ponticola TaxID=2582893 RepID=UPI0011BE5332|nr:CDP-diacylglycerol--glycerol-3-phosphate 3-phosphatidyltransferase [Shimia ponticola]